ncbi:MAG TPA: glycosyltransferase family 1 protein [Gemmatimonadaceae bacterium]|nr:glycosyltransferase family 1 protein [Gemmatimonadaceae bacterium]
MKLRIALISDHASPLAALGGTDCGGQNVYVSQVARALASQGHWVDVFTRRDDPALPMVVNACDGVRVVHVPAGPAAPVRKEEMLPFMTEFSSFTSGWCACDSRGYDIAHANFWMSGMVALELKERLDIPFVVTFHALGRVRRLYQGAADGFPEARFEIEERVIDNANRVIAECPQDEQDLLALYEADPRRISMIPCGVDTTRFRPVQRRKARSMVGLEQDEHAILQLGRLVPRKGIDNVICGVARLRDRHDVRATLIIVGGDSYTPDPVRTPEIARLMAVADREGVAEQVRFIGRRGRDCLRYYYSAADVFVTTPWYEPFGLTPLESMACGTPVIGADVGGIRYTVCDGETGYLVPPNDPEALADRLARVLTDPSHRQALAQEGLRRARDSFSWPSVARSVEELYEDVLGAEALEEADLSLTA